MAQVAYAVRQTATVEQRVGAIQAALDARGFDASQAVDELGHMAQEEWLPRNGARVVAKAWTDPAFRERLLANGRAAVMELALTMPKHPSSVCRPTGDPTYDVRFRSEDLWPNGADAALVHVGVFQSYLERV